MWDLPSLDDFWAKVDTFKRKVAEFFAVVERLQQARPLVEASGDPALREHYDAQMNRAGYVESTIRTVQDTINSAKAKLSQVGDVLDGHLGVAPLALLGIGLITGGIAAIGAWLSDSYDLLKSLEAEASRQETYDKLRAEGLSHGDALAVIEAAKPPGAAMGVLDKVGLLVALVIVGGVIWWASSREAA